MGSTEVAAWGVMRWGTESKVVGHGEYGGGA